MQKRSPIAVFLLPFVTFGIYSWYWAVKTKGEMNKLGEDIPTAWIWLIPFVGGVWWMWKYSEGVEHVTKEKITGIIAFLVLFLLGNIGQAIVQDSFNKVGEQAAAVASEYVPTAPVETEASVETEVPVPSEPTEPSDLV